MKHKRKKQPIEGMEPLLGEVAELQPKKNERRQAEEALMKSESTLNSILSSMVDLVFVLDKESRFTPFYIPSEELYIPPEEFVGKTHSEVMPPRTHKLFAEAFDKNKRGEVAEYEYWLEIAGKTEWYSVKLSPMSVDGEFAGSVAVSRNITRRKRAEEELESSRQQLRDLAAHAEAAREGERTRIARELHDEMGQALTALKMDLAWLNKALPQDQIALLEKTKTMSQLTDTAIKTVKRLATELRPGILDDFGLAAAIEWQAEEFQQRTEIECEVSLYPEDISLDQVLLTTIFRILQETLTNVARHAQATKVKISMQEKDAKLVLEVIDNGRGITKKQISNPKSLGLLGMRERVLPWQGEVKISGIPGEGTTVTVNIPLGKKGEIP